MRQLNHIVIIAGEASGDHYASRLILQLKQILPNVKITGIGGTQMQEAGATLISDLAQYGVTGIWEVLRHIRRIKAAFQAMQSHLTHCKPDLLLLIDYPGFNLRLAKFAKQKLHIPIIYYISPQIWAWKANRIHTIKKNIDHMAVIFPFEKTLYQEAQVPVSFVGHPLLETLTPPTHTPQFPQNKRLIALLPGSRRHEIEKHMPILHETALLLLKKYPNIHFIIPVAHTVEKNIINDYLIKSPLNFTLVDGNLSESIPYCEAAIVASGTASLECALFEIPMCIIYKAAWISYLLASQVIQVRYLGLCNILENAMIVPEFLQYDCSPHEIAKTTCQILDDPSYRQKIILKLQAMKNKLSHEASDGTLIGLILSLYS